MGNTTGTFGFEYPDDGADKDAWGDILNAFIEELDTDVLSKAITPNASLADTFRYLLDADDDTYLYATGDDAVKLVIGGADALAAESGTVTMTYDLTVANNFPLIKQTDLNSGADAKTWRLLSSGGDYIIAPETDAGAVTGGKHRLLLMRSGSQMVDIRFGRTSDDLSALDATSIVTRESGDLRYAQLSGATFIGPVKLSYSDPAFEIINSDVASGQRMWRFASSSSTGNLLIQNRTNAGSFNAQFSVTPAGRITLGDPGNSTDLGIVMASGQGFYKESNDIRVAAGSSTFIFETNGALNAVDSIAKRSSGDTRWAAISSSLRYKEEVAPHVANDGIDHLQVKDWIWGGDLPMDDPRRGKPGFGLIADEVAEYYPEALIYKDGRIEGLDPLTLIGVLWKEVQDMREDFMQ